MPNQEPSRSPAPFGALDPANRPLVYVNLAIRFLLELGAMIAFGYWGVHTGGPLLIKIDLGVCTPVLAALIWGSFVAPRSTVRLAEPVRLILGLAILCLAAVALAVAGHPGLAAVFALIASANAFLLYAMGALGAAEDR
jgi:hypothetical protein